MPRPVILARKGFSTLGTFVIASSPMAVHMILHDQLPGKALPAYSASMFCFGLLGNHVVEAFSEITDFGMKRAGVSSMALLRIIPTECEG